MSIFKAVAQSVAWTAEAIRARPGSYNLATPVWIQVRTATKRAAGSRTSNKDSRGRRLGIKVYEGAFIKPGSIILRQRGTKFYPGENAWIGKDHTIFALEPGFVRFYRDPFHPLRKFVGVALREDLALPTPHFAPRVRRFGYVPIEDKELKQKELECMSRKEWLRSPVLKGELAERENKRQQRKEEFAEIIAQLTGLSGTELEIASDRCVELRKYISGGRNAQESDEVATFTYKYMLGLAVKRGELTQEESQAKFELYNKVAEKLRTSVMFDADFKLVQYLSPEQREAMKKEKIDKMIEIFNSGAPAKDIRAEVLKLTVAPCFTMAERVYFGRKYGKRVLPEYMDAKYIKEGETLTPKSKNAKVINRWNYSLGKMEKIVRPSEVFA